MYKELTKGNDGKVKESVSSYQPTKAVKEVTARVIKDYQQGLATKNAGRNEFNGRNLVAEVDANQKAFNSYVPPESENPDESWRAQTVRPITRNKLISIAAHVTASILYPNIFARNDRDEEDRDSAEVMRILTEYVMDNSNYAREFVNSVITALVDPAVIIGAGFYEVMRKVKEMQADGSYTTKEILDEVMSGWQMNIVPCTELLIANIYETNIQKQRFLVRNRKIDFEDARQLYGHNKNFKYVRAGQLNCYDGDSNTFYEVYDDDLKDYLVDETTYYNRVDDLELVFVGGVLVTNVDQPNPRKDKMYGFAKSGYEPLNNGKFFYYKSAANKLGSDQSLVDTLYNMILDGTFLQLMPPMALYGREEIESSVMVPGVITSFENETTKLESIAPRVDLRAGLETSSMVERSIAESSQDNMRSGVAGEGGITAREVMLTEQNARIALGLFGKMIGFLVEDIGTLMVGDILQHMAMADVKSLTGGTAFKTFMIPDKSVDGRKVSEVVRFGLPQTGKSEEDVMYDLLAEEGGMKGKKKIYQVNPELFRNRKFKLKVSVDRILPRSLALEKALGLEQYDRLIQNDIVDRSQVTRDLVEIYKPGQSDKYMQEKQTVQQPQTEEKFVQKGVNSNMVSQLTGNNSLGVAASSEF
jgi:hypothetical protein